MIFSHSGDFGDIIYSLATIKYIGGGELVLFPSLKTRVIFNKRRFDAIYELISKQSYIENLRFTEDNIDTPLDRFRYWLRWFSLPESHMYAYGVSKEDALSFLNNKWLDIESKEESKTLFVYTRRFEFNKEPFWNIPILFNDCSFIGIEEDYDHFKLRSKYRFKDVIIARDFNHLAQIIRNAKIVIGNPTGTLALAQAMNIPTISLEKPEQRALRFNHTNTFNMYDINPLAIYNFNQFLRSNDIRVDRELLFRTLT
jgi:hypothetical protein